MVPKQLSTKNKAEYHNENYLKKISNKIVNKLKEMSARRRNDYAFVNIPGIQSARQRGNKQRINGGGTEGG